MKSDSTKKSSTKKNDESKASGKKKHEERIHDESLKEKPILFEAIDGIPVDLIFVLLAPLGTSGDHLKALARVSRLLRNESTRHKLRSNNDPLVIYSILTEENEEQAA